MDESSSRGGFIATGFLRTMILRLLTSSLLIVIPLFLTASFGLPDQSIGAYILLLWLGNGIGILTSITLLKRQSPSSLVGFAVLALSLLGMALSISSRLIVAISDLAAGLGMGMVSPFLPGLMHLDASRQNPYEGIGLYSVALGIGLILGPLVPYGLLIFRGFSAVFLTLSALAGVGLVEVVIRIFHGNQSLLQKAQYSLSLTKLTVAFKSRGFSQILVINFLYALLLPIVLSYGGVYGEARFGITSSTALLVFTAIFLVSTFVRSLAVLFMRGTRFALLISGVFLTVSFLVIGTASSFSVFLLGMLAFSIPHALVHPAANYRALRSVEGGIVMNASYAFQASSGVAEFVSPAIAVGVISLYGISSIFLSMVPIALLVLCMVAIPYLGKR